MSKRDLLRKANAGNAKNRGTEAVLNEEPVTVKPVVTKSTPVKKRIIEETSAPTVTKVEVEEPKVEPAIEPVIEITKEEPEVKSIVEPVRDVKEEEKVLDEKILQAPEKIEVPKATENVVIPETTESIETTRTSENVEKTESSIPSVSTISSKSSKMTKPAVSENLAKYTGNKISKSIMLTAEDNKFLIKQAAAQKKPIQDIFGEVMADEIEEVKKGNVDEELAETFLKLKANNERRNVLIPEDLSIAIADTASEIPLKQGKFILYALSRKRNA